MEGISTASPGWGSKGALSPSGGGLSFRSLQRMTKVIESEAQFTGGHAISLDCSPYFGPFHAITTTTTTTLGWMDVADDRGVDQRLTNCLKLPASTASQDGLGGRRTASELPRLGNMKSRHIKVGWIYGRAWQRKNVFIHLWSCACKEIRTNVSSSPIT